MRGYAGKGLYDVPPMLGCRLFNSANQSIPAGTFAALTFNSETYDFGGLHSTAALTSRITFPRSGWVIAGGTVDWSAPAATIVEAFALLRNAAETLSAQTQLDINTGGFQMSISTGFRVVAGDYIELYVQHSNAVAIDSVAGGASNIPNFWATLWPD